MSGIFLLCYYVVVALHFIETKAQDTGTACTCNSLSCKRYTQIHLGREFQVLQETLAKLSAIHLVIVFLHPILIPCGA